MVDKFLLIQVLIPFMLIIIFLGVINEYFLRFRDFAFKIMSNKKVLAFMVTLLVLMIGIIIYNYATGSWSGVPDSSTPFPFGYSIGFGFLFIGGLMNQFVMLRNNRMPVYLAHGRKPKTDSEIHFFFGNKDVEKVKSFHLCDRFIFQKKYDKIKNPNNWHPVLSIGDLFVIYGVGLMILNSVLSLL